MKTLYLDCSMGAAGDMLTAALLELLPDADGFVNELNSSGIPDVTFVSEPSVKCGITGTHMTVRVNGSEEDEHMHEHHHHHDHEHHHDLDHDHDHEHHHDHHHDHDHEHHHHHDHGHHHHASLHDIHHIVEHLNVSEKVKSDVMAVYELIAEAESAAHGRPVTEIHFHEVGTMDAIADITAVCLAMEKLSPDRVIASPVHVGSGTVHCAHGILPVPAPATAFILKGIPMYGGAIPGELCTPTGAALLRHFADSFGEMPVMSVDKIGYGMGRKDFAQANCVRAMIGSSDGSGDAVCELSCNLDDMTAEDLGFACGVLMEAGALDVWTVSAGMKKSRQGAVLSVLCKEEQREKMLSLIFRHTTTIGVRENIMRRYTLDRTADTVDTPYGSVRRKISSGYGVTRVKYEHDDLEKAALSAGKSVCEIRKDLDR